MVEKEVKSLRMAISDDAERNKLFKIFALLKDWKPWVGSATTDSAQAERDRLIEETKKAAAAAANVDIVGKMRKELVRVLKMNCVCCTGVCDGCEIRKFKLKQLKHFDAEMKRRGMA